MGVQFEFFSQLDCPLQVLIVLGLTYFAELLLIAGTPIDAHRFLVIFWCLEDSFDLLFNFLADVIDSKFN